MLTLAMVPVLLCVIALLARQVVFTQNSTLLFPMPKCKGIIIEEITIDALQMQFQRGTLNTVDLVTCYIKRIYQTNGYINSVIQINPDALEIAAQLDTERSAGKIRGPLHGVPVLTKDNMATKDKMDTTAGSWMLMGSVVPRDAFTVSKLRQAGAVLLGHSGLSEWAHMRSSNMSEGFSARGGQVRSPYNLTVNPGGSSSGSAAAVAANQCMIAFGTETDGSVIEPAERNALVGIKPTVGLTSRAGVIPESLHQDTVGTFGRTVRDAVYALDAIYGPDPRDNYTAAQIGRTPQGGYAQFLTDRTALRNATFGIPWASFWALNYPAQNVELLKLVSLLADAGATIINNTELPHYQTTINPSGWDWDFRGKLGFANESEYTVVKVDFYNDVAAYLAELGNNDIKSVEDIIQYNLDNLGSEGGLPGINPGFGGGQERFYESAATGGIHDATYHQALSFCLRTSREEGIDSALNHGGERLDALLAPSDVAQAASIPAQAGYPMITVPAGVNGTRTGMPFGLSLLGTAWSEGELIRWASAIEDARANDGSVVRRAIPRWGDYKKRRLPVLDE